MSEATKTRSLVLRQHEARRLAEHGSVVVVRVVEPQPRGVVTSAVQWLDGLWRIDHEPVPNILSGGTQLGNIVGIRLRCPFGRVGDEMAIKDKWRLASVGGGSHEFWTVQFSDHSVIPHPQPDQKRFEILAVKDSFSERYCGTSFGKWRSAATMPLWASRFTVVNAGVQCKPIGGVTEDEAIATGIECDSEGQWKHYCKPKFGPSPIHSFETLQRKLYGPDAWASNVHCWFATMRRREE